MSWKPSRWFMSFTLTVITGLIVATPCSAAGNHSAKLFFIGQDLGTVRNFFDSQCCASPDGSTFYLGFYNLLNPEQNHGGLGMNAEGEPLDFEYDSGVGLQNGWKAAHEFPGHLAIGLELAENEHPGAIDELLAGAYDENLAQLAEFLKRLDKKVWLRIAYEFDGAWNQGYQNPERYQALFRYVVDALRVHGVANVYYVWQSSTSPVDDIIDGRREDIGAFYPGDEYVDWVGLSWFLLLDEAPSAKLDFKVATQRQLMDEVVDFARQRNKPVMIAESAPQGFDLARKTNANIGAILDGASAENSVQLDSEKIWALWYQPLFDYLNSHRDVIGALAYINTNWDAQARWGHPYSEGYWGDHRLQADPLIANRFSKAINAWRNQ